MKFFLFLCLCFPMTSARAGEWITKKLQGGRSTVQISSKSSQLTINLREEIIPGDDLLLATATIGAVGTFYSRYVFLVVSGGSLHVKASVAQQRGDVARPDPNSDRVMYVEPSENGAFYFVPDELRDEGYLRVSRSVSSPGFFSISVEKKQR